MRGLKPNPFSSQEDNGKRYHDYVQKAGTRLFLLTASLMVASACFGFGLLGLVDCTGSFRWLVGGLLLVLGMIFALLSFGLAAAFASALLVWQEFDLGGRQQKIAEGIALLLIIVLLGASFFVTDWDVVSSNYARIRSYCR